MSASQNDTDPLKLVEECVGVGEVSAGGRVLSGVAYRVRRFQGMLPSGLPVPGVHRLEGTLEFPETAERFRPNADLTLTLEDGRALRVTLVDDEGHVLTEGHGPSRCLCC